MELDFKWFLSILGVFLGWVASQAWDSVKKSKEAKELDLSRNLAELTVAVTELKIKVEILSEKLSPMPKIQQDLNELHGKVREINARNSLKNS